MLRDSNDKSDGSARKVCTVFGGDRSGLVDLHVLHERRLALVVEYEQAQNEDVSSQ